MIKFKHHCPDWDFMLIDRHDPEFNSCTCNFTDITIALEVLEDLRGYSGLDTAGNCLDTGSWNAALAAAAELMGKHYEI